MADRERVGVTKGLQGISRGDRSMLWDGTMDISFPP
jgi:hypothetical protein